MNTQITIQCNAQYIIDMSLREKLINKMYSTFVYVSAGGLVCCAVLFIIVIAEMRKKKGNEREDTRERERERQDVLLIY